VAAVVVALGRMGDRDQHVLRARPNTRENPTSSITTGTPVPGLPRPLH
jgi:hypothetical protein